MEAITAYIIFGTLCTINPKIGPDWYCMNFWQDPVVHHKTLDKCEEFALKQAKDIKENFEKENLIVVKLEINCINTKTKKLEKSLKTKYNIL